MKITVWTLTTEGDNTDLETSVHATEAEATATLRSYLEDDIAELEDIGEYLCLEDLWADKREGRAIIASHEIEIAMVLP